jgi:hypothetical protein
MSYDRFQDMLRDEVEDLVLKAERELEQARRALEEILDMDAHGPLHDDWEHAAGIAKRALDRLAARPTPAECCTNTLGQPLPCNCPPRDAAGRFTTRAAPRPALSQDCEPGNCNQPKGHGGPCPVWTNPRPWEPTGD